VNGALLTINAQALTDPYLALDYYARSPGFSRHGCCPATSCCKKPMPGSIGFTVAQDGNISFADPTLLAAVPIIDECVPRAARRMHDSVMILGLLDVRIRYFQKTRDLTGCRRTVEMLEQQGPSGMEALYRCGCQRQRPGRVSRCRETRKKLTT
jgi:hypothetical protein